MDEIWGMDGSYLKNENDASVIKDLRGELERSENAFCIFFFILYYCFLLTSCCLIYYNFCFILYLFIYWFIYWFIDWFIYLFIYLSIYLFIYLFFVYLLTFSNYLTTLYLRTSTDIPLWNHIISAPFFCIFLYFFHWYFFNSSICSFWYSFEHLILTLIPFLTLYLYLLIFFTSFLAGLNTLLICIKIKIKEDFSNPF